MNMPLPQHAELPLWADKSPAQKQEALNLMVADLAVYARGKGANLPSPLVDITISHDNAKQVVMQAYTDVIGNDLAALIACLDKAKPFNEDEAKHIENIKQFIRNNPNAISQNCEAGHVTGSALIIHPETKRVLLHKHKKLGMWFQFGGHPDYETNILEVAKREAEEESGLRDLQLAPLYHDPNIPADIDLHIIPEKGSRPTHYHADMRYLFATITPEAISASEDESGDFWWLTVEEARQQPLSVITAEVQRLISKAEMYFDKARK